MLRSEGWTVNAKRVECIWWREGLKVPQKQPKRGCLWLNDGSCVWLLNGGIFYSLAEAKIIIEVWLATTTPSGGTHHSVTNHRHRKPLSGLRCHVDRHRNLLRPWRENRSCIKTATGPAYRVRPLGRSIT